MIIKVYQAVSATDLGLKVILKDGSKTYCHFINGTKYPTLQGGKFRTKNAKVQAALESHPAYGKLFVLEGESGEPDAVSIPGTFPGGDIGITDELVYHVKTAGEARVWLRDNKGAKPNDIKNIQAIDEFCAKVKVVFPDWQTLRDERGV
jgi:hypothetical protein